MKTRILSLVLLATFLVGFISPSLAGRVNAASPSTAVASPAHSHAAFFDKTRFVTDLGIAFFCIHHVYKNYKKGLYNRGASHRIAHVIAAALVLALAYDRLHKAYSIAKNSNSRTLQKLVAPLSALVNKIHGQQSDMAGGYFSDRSFKNMNGTADSFGNQVTSGGTFFHDISIPLPGGA